MSQIFDVAGDRSVLRSTPHAARKSRRWFYPSERILFAIGLVCLGLAAVLFVIDARLPPSMTAQTDTAPAVVR